MGQPIMPIQVVSSSEYREFLSQSIFEAFEALQKFEGMVLKKNMGLPSILNRNKLIKLDQLTPQDL